MNDKLRHHWQQARHSKLVKNAGVYVSGHLVQKGFAFLLLPVWVRFLSPADYGVVGTMTVYSGVLFTVYLLGLPGAAVRQYYDYLDDEAAQRSYVTSLVVFSLGLSFVDFVPPRLQLAQYSRVVEKIMLDELGG